MREIVTIQVRGDSRVRVEGEIVVEFDYSGMIQLLVYPVLPARVPGRKSSNPVKFVWER